MAIPKVPNPLKWHGGKFYLAPKIVELMPAHIHYVEPYAGGLSVLLAKNPIGVSEVVNDLNGDLTNFWRVLQDEKMFAKFVRKVEAIPFSETEWQEAAEGLRAAENCERAVAFFVRCRQSLSGRLEQFATLTRNRTRRLMNEQASAWQNSVRGLRAVHERLMRVAILNRPAVRVIEGQDGPNTLFYLDPPYVHETRRTTHEYGNQEMTDEDHKKLVGLIAACQGKFLVSNYPNSIYDELCKKYGWHRQDFNLPNNSAGGGAKRRMTESVWMNF